MQKNVVIVPSISIAIKHLLTYLVDRVHKHCPCTHSLTSDTKGNNYYKHSNVACFYHFSKSRILIGFKILNRTISIPFHCYSNSLTLIIYISNFLKHRAVQIEEHDYRSLKKIDIHASKRHFGNDQQDLVKMDWYGIAMSSLLMALIT